MNDRLTVIFDGRCRVCSRTIRMLKDLDRHDRLHMIPCQSAEGVDRYGVTPAQCEKQVFVVRGDGQVVEGGQAAMLILATALEQPWLARVGGLPIVRQVVNAGYALISRVRRRLPGPPTWCDEHPEQCTRV